jgi:hypothetical protein
MNIAVVPVPLEKVLPLRELYRQEMNCQIVQELKRACDEMGRIPAARCNVANAAPRTTLQKAGLLPCARILSGALPVG